MIIIEQFLNIDVMIIRQFYFKLNELVKMFLWKILLQQDDIYPLF